MNAKPQPIFQLAIAVMLAMASVAAAAADDFPGGNPESRVLEAQEKADELFEKGDYGRAYFIFREELVPLGDKFAQYMVGYMNIVGKGVPRDYVAGSAWYRLAAERGEVSFSQARDEVLGQFDDEQRRQSDDEYAALRAQYSDAMIIANFIEHDLDEISNQMQSSTLSNDLVDSTDLSDSDRAQLIADAQHRIQVRLEFLNSTIASGRPMADVEIARIRDIEKRAQAALN